MGRIDEALRRAAEHDEGGEQPTLPATTLPALQTEAFVSPWTFTVAPGAPVITSEPMPGEEPTSPGTSGGRAEPMALFRGFNRAIEERLVLGKGAPPLLAEQFRRLAATLHHAQLVQKLKVVMVTSANASEGAPTESGSRIASNRSANPSGTTRYPTRAPARPWDFASERSTSRFGSSFWSPVADVDSASAPIESSPNSR